jgi:Spy/CpxP family protein refolding chaperone
MRSMMRVSAAMLALLVAANVAVAQGGGGGGGGGRGQGGRGGAMQAERLLTDITLTAEQQTKVAEVAKWYDDESAKLPQAQRGAPPDSAAMAARQKLTTDFRAKLKALLTAEQQKKFDENVAAMGQRGRRGGGGF